MSILQVSLAIQDREQREMAFHEAEELGCVLNHTSLDRKSSILEA